MKSMSQVGFFSPEELRAAKTLSGVKSLWSQCDSRSPRPSMSLRVNPGGFIPQHMHPRNIYVVMTVDNQVIATATIVVVQTSQKSCVQIEDFVVHPAHRRQGHGYDLISAILDHFGLHGQFYFTQVEVHPSREAMVGLLRKANFVQCAVAASDQDGTVHVFRRNFFKV